MEEYVASVNVMYANHSERAAKQQTNLTQESLLSQTDWIVLVVRKL